MTQHFLFLKRWNDSMCSQNNLIINVILKKILHTCICAWKIITRLEWEREGEWWLIASLIINYRIGKKNLRMCENEKLMRILLQKNIHVILLLKIANEFLINSSYLINFEDSFDYFFVIKEFSPFSHKFIYFSKLLSSSRDT